MEQNLQLVFASRPSGGLFDPAKTFAQKKVPVPTHIPDSHVLVKVLYLSIDPAMRTWLNDTRSYIEPMKIGDVMRAFGLGVVVLSRHSDFKKGDYVTSIFGWQQYGVAEGKELKKVKLVDGIRLTDYLGPLGLTGMTAYFGLLDIGKPKAGDTVVVSGAAGSTGSLVGQIAKIKGCYVVGIAGSDEKCQWLKDLGFDVAINYNSPTFKKDFLTATPRLVDVFFDNVGGSILELVLSRINLRGRIVVSGAISQYNEAQPKGPANYTALVIQRARMEGFVVLDYASRYSEATRHIAQWIRQGKIQRQEHIVDGLENAPAALLGLFRGENTGKMMIKVASEDSGNPLKYHL